MDDLQKAFDTAQAELTKPKKEKVSPELERTKTELKEAQQKISELKVQNIELIESQEKAYTIEIAELKSKSVSQDMKNSMQAKMIEAFKERAAETKKTIEDL